ncbi:HAD family hydrolase [Chondromyces crocatus]|uniref:Phosphoserine phosphatase n=1 Tax=Chondromyces crocatus TaxID=52 RepID=A0A0K1E7T8_CHOCO|nr:HAD family hydrolase [Chondromyces crocatus]AKT36930.1 phosphoserine phosphatase [Chondromyces crocatus]
MTETAPAPKSPLPRKRAALFDMDRTLIRRETVSLYVRYQREIGEASLLDLVKTLYWVAQYTLGLLDAERVVDRILQSLRGTSEAALTARCNAWFASHVEQHISDEGRQAVRRHQEAGDVCAIVTAATSYTTWPLAHRLNIPHVVATVLEVDPAGHFTGRPVRPLCYGEGKVERARALAEAHGFRLEEATFYSDSISDLPLLSLVAEPVAVNPDPRLRRIAQRRGWPIVRW